MFFPFLFFFSFLDIPALTVRLLTNRYITSYIRGSPTLTSSRHLSLCGHAPATPSTPTSGQPPLHVTARDLGSNDTNIANHLDWAQCVVVVCARNDPSSFKYAQMALELHKEKKLGSPIVLVANKADLPEEEKVQILFHPRVKPEGEGICR